MSIEAAQQPKRRARLIRTERKIIPRPRLIKRLDRSRARTILLLAPAGFGKTTLARQWRETLTRAVMLSLTPAHRDVTVIARDLARSIEAAGVDGYVAFMEQYIRARSSPQSEAASLGRALADGLEKSGTEWVIVDDYHDVADTPEAEELIETVLGRTTARFLIASRVRPSWARERKSLYGEVESLTRKTLAMDNGEAQTILGRPGRLARQVIAMADGWPAALALAATVEAPLPSEVAPEGLHRYLAEEYLDSLSTAGQSWLTEQALVPERPLAFAGLPDQDARLLQAMVDDSGSMHRLLREFLLTKLARDGERATVQEAVTWTLRAGHWERAFELIELFEVNDRIEEATELAYCALEKTGQIWTLFDFVEKVGDRLNHLSGVVALVEAEAARREGRSWEVLQVAARAQRVLGVDHRLFARAACLEGEAQAIAGEFTAARCAFVRSERFAQDKADAERAEFGLARTEIFTDSSGVDEHLKRFEERRDRSADDLLRYGFLVQHRSAFLGAVAIQDAFSEAYEVRRQGQDIARVSAAIHLKSVLLGYRAEYYRASLVCDELFQLIEEFDLRWAKPHSYWGSALIQYGLRRIGKAFSDLEIVGQQAREHRVTYHELNYRALKARMLLGLGRSDDAFVYVEDDPPATQLTILAEYWATRSMVCAARGDLGGQAAAVRVARSLSRTPEARSQTAVSEAMVAALQDDRARLLSAMQALASTECLDPLVTALRGFSPLLEAVKSESKLRPVLRDLCQRADDRQLARRLDIKLATEPQTVDVLSPRELEVLGLLAQGLRNDEIAKSLFISRATVKVHINHLFAKLGVRTRAQAVVAYQRTGPESDRPSGLSSLD